MIPVYTPNNGSSFGFAGDFYDEIESLVKTTRKDLRSKSTLTEFDESLCFSALNMWSYATSIIADHDNEECGYGVHKSINQLLTFEAKKSLPPLNAILAVVLYAQWRMIYVDSICANYDPKKSPAIKKIILGPISGGEMALDMGPVLLETTFSLPTGKYLNLQTETSRLCDFVRQDAETPSGDTRVYDGIANDARLALKKWIHLVSAHTEIKVNKSLVREACKKTLNFDYFRVNEMLVLNGYLIFRQIEDAVGLYHAGQKALFGNPLADNILS